MLSNFGQNCTDVDEFRSAVRPVDNEIILTRSGSFSASVIKIDLHRLWMQQTDETLARSWWVEMEPSRIAVGFSAEAGQLMRHQGIELAPDEISVFTPGNPVWHTTFGPSRFASISLPKEDLIERGSAMAGQSVIPAELTMTIKVAPALMQHMRSRYAAAVHLAQHTPAALEDPDQARRLEAGLADAMVLCLRKGRARTETACQRRHAAVIRRLHALEETARDRPLYLAEVCSALGVSERTLNEICRDMLGVGPKRYLSLRRLHLARRELRRSLPGEATVTDVATRYGFWELGRFAVAYRSVFGECPSATLRRRVSY